jgi:hypothetical protein
MIPTGEDMRTKITNRGHLLNQTRRLIVLLIALALTVINTSEGSVVATSSAVQPTVMLQTPAAPMLAGTFQVVNNGPGDQTDPDLDCSVTSYVSNDLQGTFLIHVIDASTNTNYIVPGNGLDTQPDVAGKRIVFTEQNALGAGVAVYDTGKKITTDQARQLISSANQIKTNLGCP